MNWGCKVYITLTLRVVDQSSLLMSLQGALGKSLLLIGLTPRIKILVHLGMLLISHLRYKTELCGSSVLGQKYTCNDYRETKLTWKQRDEEKVKGRQIFWTGVLVCAKLHHSNKVSRAILNHTSWESEPLSTKRYDMGVMLQAATNESQLDYLSLKQCNI